MRTPVDSQEADYIKKVIGEKIKRAGVALCLVGQNTYKSNWVDWELEESEKQGNSIVAMALKGIESIIFPKYLKDSNIIVYKWDPNYLVTLINNA